MLFFYGWLCLRRFFALGLYPAGHSVGPQLLSRAQYMPGGPLIIAVARDLPPIHCDDDKDKCLLRLVNLYWFYANNLEIQTDKVR